MYLYLITSGERPGISIFARSYDGAVQLFMAWWSLSHRGDLPDIEAQQRNPSWPGLNTDHLHDALMQGVSGIGIYDPGAGWTIIPPERFEEIA